MTIKATSRISLSTKSRNVRLERVDNDTCAAAYKVLGNPFSEKNFTIAYHDGTDWVTVKYVEGTDEHSKFYPLLQLLIKEK